jgi:hypothetical protein
MVSSVPRKAKGIIVLEFAKILRRAKDERLLEGLTPEERKLVASKILPSSWYSYDFFARMLVNVHEKLSHFRTEAALEMGRYIATTLLQGHYGIYLKPGDPAATLKGFGIYFRNYFNFGRAFTEIPDEGDGEEKSNYVMLGLEDFPDIPRPLCLIIQGMTVKAVELAGGIEPSLHELSCAALGDSRCWARIEWLGVSSE